jgi:asparagine synthase (glutamine-hydrolysing)
VLRFIALAWNHADPAQTAAAQLLTSRLHDAGCGWSEVFRNESLVVLAARMRPSQPVLRLSDNAGAVLGAVFRAADDSQYVAVTSLTEDESSKIVASGARRLVECYWGSYVAFVHDRATRRNFILRAPRSPLTCFTATFRGAHVYFSRTEDVASLGLVALSVDWQRVAICVVYGSGGTRGSAVSEVSELKPGECVEHQRERVHRALYWDPLAIAQANVVEDVSLAAAAVRKAVQGAAWALASSHRTVVHTLSGGLDSSIVACCLGNAPAHPEVVCINDYSSGPDSDERKFARLAAQRGGFALIERERRSDLRFEQFLRCVRTAVPSPQFLELAHDRPAVDLAYQRAATAVFTGVQGDATFYMYPPAQAAADFALRRGIRPALFRQALGIARLERTSVWHVLRIACRARLRRGKIDYWAIQRGFLDLNPGKSIVNMQVADDLARHAELMDPMFQDAAEVPPGKLWQIFQMTSASAYEDSFSLPADPEFVHPLMAQPVAEICLRIPTYTHLTNGWDRAVARLAFADDLPVEIRRRTSKGGLEEYAKEMSMRNIGFMRELLLNGFLVRERILNRPILEQALSGSPSKTSVTAAMLLIYLSVEVWVNSWHGAARRAVA